MPPVGLRYLCITASTCRRCGGMECNTSREMRHGMGLFKSNQSKVFVLSLCALWLCRAASAKTPPPFRYVQARAFHILQETHSEQSGYFSLSESLDGTIHVGTAKYNENAFLVEFDPRTGKQRIVLD